MADQDPAAALACAPNFRAVSGQRTGSGATIRPGRLFRSDAIHAPAEADRAALAGHDLRLVYDLRSRTEREARPTNFWPELGARVRAVDLLEHVEGAASPWAVLADRPDSAGADAAMRAVYDRFPAALHGQFAEIVEGILSSGGATLVHCTAGKDRTGFLVAMLLATIGVEREAIIGDYLASQGRASMAAREATAHLVAERLGRALPEAALDRLMSVQPTWLAASFAQIDDAFGGLSGYMATAGITPNLARRLEAVLTA